MSDSNNQSNEHTETDENDDSSAEADVYSRFSFTRTVFDEAPMQKKKILEHKKKYADAIARNSKEFLLTGSIAR